MQFSEEDDMYDKGQEGVTGFLESEINISPNTQMPAVSAQSYPGSFAGQDNAPAAIQFISISEDEEEFEVTAEAMSFLASLPRDKQVKVISVAGPYRSGKSFLMNRLMG